MVKAIVMLVAFFRGTTSFLQPDEEALRASGVNRERYIIGHRRIVNLARFFGVAGFVLWFAALLLGSLMVGFPTNDPRKVVVICLSPFFGCLIGVMVGAILGCLLAPGDFLRGPAGAKWLSLVGTKNLVVARLICLVCFILVGYFFVAMTFMSISAGLNIYPPALLQGEIIYMDEKGLPMKK